ncbi:MAG: hypothetical protein ACJA1J_003201 [Sulfitobacter pontiacus]|jgi:hypothetical protein
MPAALLHFSSLRRSQHNYVRAMPALKFQQNLRQNRPELGLREPIFVARTDFDHSDQDENA